MLKDPDGNFVEIVGPNTKALKKKKSKNKTLFKKMDRRQRIILGIVLVNLSIFYFLRFGLPNRTPTSGLERLVRAQNFPEANLKERLGSEFNDPLLYQPLFYWDLFNKRKIKELIDTEFKLKN